MIMSYVYCIKNELNEKKYVGKTSISIDKRFKEHCADSCKERCEKRPLYDAMQKYGIDKFSIQLLEECVEEEINFREIFWIEELDTYRNGYNATLGGEGTPTYNYKDLVETYKTGLTVKETAKKHCCCTDTVSKALHIYKVDTYENYVTKCSTVIEQYDLKGNFLQSFCSMNEASRWLYDNNYTTNLSVSSIRTKISNVAKGKSKTAYKFKWKFKE